MAEHRQCMVEGCQRRSVLVQVWLSAYSATDILAPPAEAQELVVCQHHAEMLGTVRDLESDYEMPWVKVDPERAAGWRLLVTVRPSGRWAVVMEEPCADS